MTVQPKGMEPIPCVCILPSTRTEMRRSRIYFVTLVLSVGLVALGCQQDEITQYKVPKAEYVKHEAPKAGKGTERMLAAMLPRTDRAWFLKFQGPDQDVAAHK